jgi:tetratricopeptide (TPR) repeat protein
VARILPGDQLARVAHLCRAGEEHVARGERAEALACYIEAWELLPEPADEWDAAGLVFDGMARLIEAHGDLALAMELLLAADARLGAALAARVSPPSRGDHGH